MSSFAQANCLIQIEEDVTNVQEQTVVDIHLFPI
jgi:molybdopterin biosynthesis enzyme